MARFRRSRLCHIHVSGSVNFSPALGPQFLANVSFYSHLRIPAHKTVRRGAPIKHDLQSPSFACDIISSAATPHQPIEQHVPGPRSHSSRLSTSCLAAGRGTSRSPSAVHTPPRHGSPSRFPASLRRMACTVYGSGRWHNSRAHERG
jgi:hypothetical protein